MALAIVNFQNRCHVATAIAIVGGTKYGNYLLVMTPIISLHD
uniref:Serine/threonine-protein phosphatase PP2A catalytic subunit isoform X1 n=1 Tax=Rhizophora mucronata TaxID=61149 RepID=A0A2P2NK68_RHIMU